MSAVSRKKRENHFPFAPTRRHRPVVPLRRGPVFYYLQTVRTLAPRQVESNAPELAKGWAINFPFIRNVVTYKPSRCIGSQSQVVEI